jgi:ribosomal protein L31
MRVSIIDVELQLRRHPRFAGQTKIVSVDEGDGVEGGERRYELPVDLASERFDDGRVEAIVDVDRV